MPVDPIVSTIVGSVIGSAVQQISALPPPSPPVPAVGIPRILPQGTAKGELQMTGAFNAEIDGKVVMLAPGVQVRDPLNMSILPTMIQGTVPVRYTTDPSGTVNRIWVLSAQEAAQP
jgi:hypothetical protein